MNQRTFDFPRGSQLALLDRLTDLAPRARLALRCIDNTARGSFDPVVLSYADFVGYGFGSRMTARRAVADLVAVDLIMVDQIINGQGQRANAYRICWSNLRAWADGERPLARAAVKNFNGGKRMESGPGMDATPCSQRTPPLFTENTPPVHEEHPPCSQRTPPLFTENTPPVHEEHPPCSQRTPHLYTPITYGNEYKNPPTGTRGGDTVGTPSGGISDFHSDFLDPKNFRFSRKLSREDFFEPERIEELYLDVQERDLVNGSEFERLQFFALVVYVRRQPPDVKSKPALLVSLLRGNGSRYQQEWRTRPTDADMDVARKLVRQVDFEQPVELRKPLWPI